MIEWLWDLTRELGGYIQENFNPISDTLDILVVAFAIYWMLLLIRGTRAVQILLGLLVLITVSFASETLQLDTLRLILDNFLPSAAVIIVVLFQQDIRRALARVGRGFFPQVSDQQESQILEEIVRAAQTLAQKRVGALIVMERETGLDDQIEAGHPVDAAISKELLTALFLPYSPLHDGAVVIQNGRLAVAGAILPLTLKADLPEGVGTRHRAAVGITEETDAVVIVVSEETTSISVVMSGEMLRDLDPPKLRVVLRDILAGDRRDFADLRDAPTGEEALISVERPAESADPARVNTAS
jgi:diadenylate cyclase